MKAVFADTAFFLALVNARDHLHPQAANLNEHPPGPMITTEWVLMELGDALAVPSGRTRFVRLVTALRNQPDLEIIPATHDLFERARALFAQRTDKMWSLTDCTSFVGMKDHGLTAALTGDQHFEQAGFQRLMQP